MLAEPHRERARAQVEHRREEAALQHRGRRPVGPDRRGNVDCGGVVPVRVVDGAGRGSQAQRGGGRLRRMGGGGDGGGRLLRARQPHLHPRVGLAAVREEQLGAGKGHRGGAGARPGGIGRGRSGKPHLCEDRAGRVDGLVEYEEHVAVAKVDRSAEQGRGRGVVRNVHRRARQRRRGVAGQVGQGAYAGHVDGRRRARRRGECKYRREVAAARRHRNAVRVPLRQARAGRHRARVQEGRVELRVRGAGRVGQCDRRGVRSAAAVGELVQVDQDGAGPGVEDGQALECRRRQVGAHLHPDRRRARALRGVAPQVQDGPGPDIERDPVALLGSEDPAAVDRDLRLLRVRERDGDLVRAGPSRRGRQRGRVERNAHRIGAAAAAAAARRDHQREQGGGRARNGPDVLVKAHRQHAAAHVKGRRARGVKGRRAVVRNDRRGHAARAARRGAVPGKGVARQVGRKAVVQEDDRRRAEPEKRRLPDGLDQGGPLIRGDPRRYGVVACGRSAVQRGVAGERDPVAAVAAGRAVEHGNVNARGGRGLRAAALLPAAKGAGRGRYGLVKVHLDRAVRQVEHRQYGRRIDRRRDRVGHDPGGNARGGRRRVAGQVVKGAGGDRQQGRPRRAAAARRQGRLLAVREKDAQVGRRGQGGRGKGRRRRRVGDGPAPDGRAVQADRLRMRRERYRRAVQADPPGIDVLVQADRDQAVCKVQDGRG